MKHEKQCKKHTLDSVKYDKYAKGGGGGGGRVSSLNISFAVLGDERCETCAEHKIHIKECTEKQFDDGRDRKRKKVAIKKIEVLLGDGVQGSQL